MRHLFTTILIILDTAWGAGAQLVPASGDIPVNDPGLKYGIQTAIEVRKELSRDLELNAGVEARGGPLPGRLLLRQTAALFCRCRI